MCERVEIVDWWSCFYRDMVTLKVKLHGPCSLAKTLELEQKSTTTTLHHQLKLQTVLS